MAKFKASPSYSVHAPKGKINFDHNGDYETDKADEIALLKALSPRYLTVVDEGTTKSIPAKATIKAEAKPAAKAQSAPRKPTAKK